jgi:fructoselysine-6-P-deglycase FrlB-like protein
MTNESVLLSEIAEQPGVLERLLRDAAPEIEAIASEIRARGVHHVVMAARGSRRLSLRGTARRR